MKLISFWDFQLVSTLDIFHCDFNFKPIPDRSSPQIQKVLSSWKINVILHELFFLNLFGDFAQCNFSIRRCSVVKRPFVIIQLQRITQYLAVSISIKNTLKSWFGYRPTLLWLYALKTLRYIYLFFFPLQITKNQGCLLAASFEMFLIGMMLK